MPSKAICCGDRAVVVSVYVEKPRGSLKPESNHHHIHHGRLRQRPVHHRRVDGGPNRRANLLRYCQNLRELESVESPELIPSHYPLSASTASRLSSSVVSARPRQTPSTEEQQDIKIISGGAQHKRSKTPIFLGDLRQLIPRFMNSRACLNRRKEKRKEGQNKSEASRMTAANRSLDVQQKLGFIKKLLTALRKRWRGFTLQT